MLDETAFLKDVARRLQAIGDAERLQPQIRGAQVQLAELERLIGEHGYAAAGVSDFLREAAEANGRLQRYQEALNTAERVIRETAYCLPMLTYEGGEPSDTGG